MNQNEKTTISNRAWEAFESEGGAVRSACDVHARSPLDGVDIGREGRAINARAGEDGLGP